MSAFMANIYDIIASSTKSVTLRRVTYLRKLLAALAVVVLFAGLISAASASLAQFEGKWVNTDPNTRGITKLAITVSGSNINVHVWGKCSPTDCDWGTAEGVAYSPSVNSNMGSDVSCITAVFTESFKETMMVIQPSGNHLKVQTYNRFTDGSGRANYIDQASFMSA